MSPQSLDDLAERFALIIDGLCDAILAQHRPFPALLFRFLLPRRLRLIRQQLAEFAALLRAGKLWTLAPSPVRTASGEALSRSSGPATRNTATWQ